MIKDLNFNIREFKNTKNDEYVFITVDAIDEPIIDSIPEDMFKKQFTFNQKIVHQQSYIDSLNYYYIDGFVTVNSIPAKNIPIVIKTQNDKFVNTIGTDSNGYYKIKINNNLESYKLIVEHQSRTYNTMIRDYVSVCETNPNLTFEASKLISLDKINPKQKNINLALKKPVEAVQSYVQNIQYITDGITTNDPYTSSQSNISGVIVDLEDVFILNKVIVIRYFWDQRIFHDHKTEISVDKKHWTTIYDSNINGEYKEVAGGKTILFPPSAARYIRSTVFKGNSVNWDVYMCEIMAYYSE